MKRLLWLVMSVVVLTAVGLFSVFDATAQSAMPGTGVQNAVPGNATPRQPATNGKARAVDTRDPRAAGTTPAPMAGGAAPSDYVIGPEDVLQISVWKNES